MTDIFEEVDESLRKDRLGDLWKRYSLWVYALIVLVIAGVGVSELLKSQRAGEIDKDAKVFDTAATALEKKDLPTAKSGFAQLGQGKGGFAVLADHMAAGVEKTLTNDTAAVGQHLSAAAERDKGLMGDLATLKLAYLKADTAKLDELEAIVAPLIKRGGQAGALARELVAAKALAGGDVERARTEYQALAIEIEAPQAMKQRVSQALQALPPKAAAAAAPASTTSAVPAPAPAAPAQPPAQPPAKPGKQ